MVTTVASAEDRLAVLRFAASFVWADLEVHDDERRFLHALAEELDVADVDALLAEPPIPEDIDPSGVPPRLAAQIRAAALRAIAADGRIDGLEMALFELLDELLPR